MSSSKYTIALFDQNDCPSGWGHLISANACRAAASELGLKASPHDAIFIKRDSPVRPNGCFRWVTGSVYFNTLTHSIPAGPIRGAAVCNKRITTPSWVTGYASLVKSKSLHATHLNATVRPSGMALV